MKQALFFFFLYPASLAVYSQSDSTPVRFMFVSPCNSQTSTNIFLDNQGADTLSLGYIIQVKRYGNVMVNVQPAIPLREQFTCILDSFNTEMKGNRKLLLQLGRLKFSGPRDTRVTKRYLLFRANLFEVSEKGYCKLGSIDTTATIDPKNNKYFLQNCYSAAGKIINGFIGSYLVKPLMNCEYSALHQIEKIDSIQKSQISLYIHDTLSEGVYTSYQSLRDQVPDYTEFDYKLKDGVPVKIEKKSNDADNMDYSFSKVYAVVINNKVFIHDDYRYALLEKRGADFYFNSKVKTEKNVPFLIFGTLALAVNTVTDATNAYKTEYVMKLDHIDGSFIPYNIVKTK